MFCENEIKCGGGHSMKFYKKKQKSSRLTEPVHTHKANTSPRVDQRLSLDKLLGFEETSQIQHLPGGEAEQAAHAEYAEEQDSVVCGFCKENGRQITSFEGLVECSPLVSRISSSRFLMSAKSWTMASERSSSFLSSNSSGLSLAASAI